MTVAKRLKCIKPIPAGATKHKGPHNHSLDKKVVHFCEAKYGCRMFCVSSFSHRHLDAKTAVTFALCLLVSYKRGPTIPTRANDLLKGHPQQEHETRHGSMSRTRWTMDGPDDVPLEIEGRKFSTNDEGAPMMCNLVCSAMGRHVHIDYCRADDEAACTGNEELQHLTKRIQPSPDRAKDVLTHTLFWKRSGE